MTQASASNTDPSTGEPCGLRILRPGVLDLIQDGGRYGFQRFGVGPAGAMDKRALAVANTLVGNPPDGPAIEFLHASGTIEAVGGPLRVAVAGAPGPVEIDGRQWPSNRSFTLAAGTTLRAGPRERGQRGYIAVGGRFALTPVMGSYSTHQRGGFGGLDGRALNAGDFLAVTGCTPESKPDGIFPDDQWPDGSPVPKNRGTHGQDPASIRVVLGPQDDHFTPAALETLTTADYTIGNAADRMGYRLEGPVLETLDGHDIVSDAIATGSVQVPGMGTPIILLADRQTTGGFPKIATVISADLPRLAQLGPGDRIRFHCVGLDEAGQAANQDQRWTAGLSGRIVPAVLQPEDMTSSYLLDRNLITAYWDDATAES